MKILVLSDSHSTLSFMRRCIDAVKPNAIIHLGDHFDDGTAMKEEYPGIPFYQVPGNCDSYLIRNTEPAVLCYDIDGVRLFMTHGHNHHVKTGLYALLKDARAYGAAAALYGHTHEALCRQEEDGLWVLNPGPAGSSGGSVGLLETDGTKITACRVLGQTELEEIT